MSLNSFKACLTVEDITLRDNINFNKETEAKVIEDITNQINKNLLDFFKKDHPNVSDDAILVFIKTYIDFNFEVKRDVKGRSTILEVTPVWKPVNEISFNELDLLNKGFDIYD